VKSRTQISAIQSQKQQQPIVLIQQLFEHCSQSQPEFNHKTYQYSPKNSVHVIGPLPLWIKRRFAESENLLTQKTYSVYTLTMWYWILNVQVLNSLNPWRKRCGLSLSVLQQNALCPVHLVFWAAVRWAECTVVVPFGIGPRWLGGHARVRAGVLKYFSVSQLAGCDIVSLGTRLWTLCCAQRGMRSAGHLLRGIHVWPFGHCSGDLWCRTVLLR